MTEQNNPQVDLNTANADALAELPGISDKLAQNIIDRREEQPFETAEDIKSVKGISDKLFDQLQPLVTVSADGSDEESAGDVENDTVDETENETEAAAPPAPIEADDAEESTEEEPEPVSESAPADEAEGAPAEEPESPAETDEGEEEQPEEPETPVEEVVDTPEEEKDDGEYVIMWPNENEEAEAEESTVDVSPEPEPTSEPATEPVAAPAPQPAPANAPSSAENFRRPWLLMIVGTLLGAFIALGALYIINDGVLVFANHPKVNQMETALSNLEQRETALNEKIGELQSELTVLSGMKKLVESNQTDIKSLNQTDETLTEQLTLVDGRSTALEERAEEVEDKVSTQGKDIASLRLATNKLDEALQEVEEDTARFDGFLEGLAELLIQAQE